MSQVVTTPAGGTFSGGGGGRMSPKDQTGLCDYYFAKPSDRSPLYGRTSTAGDDIATVTPTTPKTCNLHHHRASEKKYSTAATGLSSVNGVGSSGGGSSRGVPIANAGFMSECSASSIQRLRNDDSGVVAGTTTTASTTECDSLFSVHDESIDELYGYYNLGCSVTSSLTSSVNSSTVEVAVEATSTKGGGSNESDTDKTTVDKETSTSKKLKVEEKPSELPPPVIKKKAR